MAGVVCCITHILIFHALLLVVYGYNSIALNNYQTLIRDPIPNEGVHDNIVAMETTRGRRHVMVKVNGMWARRSEAWMASDEHDVEIQAADDELQELSDGMIHVGAVYDSRNRLRQCQMSHDRKVVQDFINEISVDLNRLREMYGDATGTNAKSEVNGDSLFDDLFDSSKSVSNHLPPVSQTPMSVGNGYFSLINHKSVQSRLTQGLNLTKLIADCRRFQAKTLAPTEKYNTTSYLDNQTMPTTMSIAPDHRPGHRSRRSISYPGTLWCGPGNTAKSAHALGEHSFTDRCCRSHDFCPVEMQILAFKTKYYYYNKQMFTLSHCACDKRFHKCLRQVRNEVSYQVGNAYFNVFSTHCFVVRQRKQCIEKGWFGRCNKNRKRPTAMLRAPQAFPKTLVKRNRSRSTNRRRKVKVHV